MPLQDWDGMGSRGVVLIRREEGRGRLDGEEGRKGGKERGGPCSFGTKG